MMKHFAMPVDPATTHLRRAAAPEAVEELSDDDVQLDDGPDSESALSGVYEIPKNLEKHERLSMTAHAATEASSEHPDRNEDAHLFSTERGIVAVADGMGGVPAGHRAAAVAIHQLTREKLLYVRQRAMEYGDLALAQKAIMMEHVFTSSRDSIMDQNEVEEAVAAMLIKMNEAVEGQMKGDPVARERAVEYFNKYLTKEYGTFDPDNQDHQRFLQNILGAIGSTMTFFKGWRSTDGKSKITIGQSGDSRLYRFREDELHRLTRDSSPVGVLLELGLLKDDQDLAQELNKKQLVELANETTPDGKPKYPDLVPLQLALVRINPPITLKSIRHIMSQVIGGASLAKKQFGIDFIPQVRTEDVEKNDIYLDLSDGVIDNVPDQKILEIVRANKDNLPKAIEKLKAYAVAQAALAGGKPDDITAVGAQFN